MKTYQIRKGYQIYKQPPVIDDSWKAIFVVDENDKIIGTGHDWVVVNGEVVGYVVGPISTSLFEQGFSAFLGAMEQGRRWLGEFRTQKAAAMAVVNACSPTSN